MFQWNSMYGIACNFSMQSGSGPSRRITFLKQCETFICIWFIIMILHIDLIYMYYLWSHILPGWSLAQGAYKSLLGVNLRVPSGGECGHSSQAPWWHLKAGWRRRGGGCGPGNSRLDRYQVSSDTTSVPCTAQTAESSAKIVAALLSLVGQPSSRLDNRGSTPWIVDIQSTTILLHLLWQIRNWDLRVSFKIWWCLVIRYRLTQKVHSTPFWSASQS